MSTPYLEAKKTALLVVDYQNFYLDEGSLLEMPNAREGLPLMNDLVTRMKEKGCLIVYIRCTHYLMHNNAYPRKWPQHFKPDGDCYLKPGTHDFDVCDQLAKVADYYVDKDRWSAFSARTWILSYAITISGLSPYADWLHLFAVSPPPATLLSAITTPSCFPTATSPFRRNPMPQAWRILKPLSAGSCRKMNCWKNCEHCLPV